MNGGCTWVSGESSLLEGTTSPIHKQGLIDMESTLHSKAEAGGQLFGMSPTEDLAVEQCKSVDALPSST